MALTAAAFASGLIAGKAALAVSTWNAGSSNWNTAANWTPVGVPGAGDTVNITNTDGVNRVITYDYTGAAVTLNSLTIDLTGNVANSDTLSMAANNLTVSGTEFVGDSGAGSNGVGVFNQSGGTNTVGTIELGVNGTDTGYYYLSSNGTLSDSGTLWIGYFGSGVFNQSGGANQVASSELIGTGNSGTFGAYIQSGGTNQAGALIVGDTTSGNTGVIGTYNLSGGTLTSTNRAYLGYALGSTGNFIQSGGTFNALAGLTVGLNAAGVYNLSGGSLSVTGSEIVGSSGTTACTFLQSGGTNAVSGDLIIGENANSNVYNLSGGTLGSGALTVGGNLNIGDNGTGTLLLNAAGQAITVTGALNIAVGAGSVGHLSVTGNGAFCNLSAGSINIGGNANNAGGSAAVTIGQGGILLTSGTLTLYNTSGVALNLNGGTLDVGQINFGGTLARFNWTSGTFNVSGNSNVFAVDNTTNSFSIGPSFTFGAGKTLIVPAEVEWVGYDGNGSLTQTGGTNITAAVALGASLQSTVPNANGIYTLSGGNLNCSSNTASGELVVGYVGPGLFNQTGGVATTGLLAVGVLSGAAGTVNLSGTASMLITNEVDLGFNALGVLNQSGGTVVMGSSTASANMSIGASVNTTGIYNLSGGTLVVNGDVDAGGDIAGITGLIPGPGGTGILTVGPGASATITGTLLIYNTPGTLVSLNGGSLTVGVMDTMGTPADFNWSSGTLTLTNTNLAFDSLASTANDPLGPNFNLSSGQILVVSQNENIGGVGSGSLTVGAGATNTVLGNLSVNAEGTLNLSGGTLQAGSINLSGGTILGTLINTSTFNYLSGTFTGRLVNQGTVNLIANFTASGGIENDTTLSVPAGRTVTTGSTGIDNLGTLFLNGGVLAGSPVLNDYSGILYGYGTIQPALTNDGSLNVTGPLTLNTASINNGTIGIPAGAVIRGSTVTNNGSITLSGGAITASLSNPAQGTVGGYGSVTGGFTNTGTVEPGSSGVLDITTAWTNAGLVNLQYAGGILSGGTITNTATIEGDGEITATVLNTTGIIRAQGGQLELAGTGNTIGATGQIQALASGTILYVQGLAVNAGTISNFGGTFDNGDQPLTNTGMIEGTGIFDAGSWNSTSGAQINLTANASFSGPLTNAGAMHLYGDNITFYGNVVNAGTVKVTNGSVFFLGVNGATIGGSYTSDPSDNYFNNLTTTPTGIVSGGTGDRFFIMNGSTFINAGTFHDLGTLSANTVTNSGTFFQTGTLIETGNFNNSGTATIGGTQNWSSGTTFTNTAGTATFLSDAGATGENLSVNISGGSVVFASTQHLVSLSIGAVGSAQITGGGNGHRSVVFTPSFSDGGTLDLTGNDLDVQAGGPAALAKVTALVAQGYNNGKWTGSGITSSSAATDTTHLTAVGVILNTIGGSTPLYTTFDGATVAVNDVLVKYTYYGDANLDGKVDASDYSRIDNGYLNHLSGWFNGDFNYDGVVNGSDYTLIDNAYNMQGAQLDAQDANPSASIAAQIAGGSSAVPEPGTIGLVTVTSSLLLGRRRRK